MMKPDPQEKAKLYKSYVKTSAVGLEVGLSILIAATLGYFFDKEFSFEPYGLIFGFLVGIIAAARTLYAFTKKYLAEDKKSEEEKR